jgi:quinol monooxygenase YgiN
MTILRHYSMRAAAGESTELEAALVALAARIRAQPGCEKVEIFADAADGDRYLFLEHWRSPADRDAAGAQLGKQAFAAVAATLAGAPEAHDLSAIGL